MIELKVINKHDPLKRRVEKQDEATEYSPMDPPDAFSPPSLDNDVSIDEYHPFLKQLVKEHGVCTDKLNDFEETLLHIQKMGIDGTVDKRLAEFFHFFDDSIVMHNQKEDKQLFPLLQKRLLENGEHGHGKDPVTAIDMLEDDHITALQLASVVFNFFGLAMRLPDPDSRIVVLDAAIEQGKALVELLKLHIFREDNVVFPMAHKYISQEEFEQIDNPKFSV